GSAGSCRAASPTPTATTKCCPGIGSSAPASATTSAGSVSPWATSLTAIPAAATAAKPSPWCKSRSSAAAAGGGSKPPQHEQAAVDQQGNDHVPALDRAPAFGLVAAAEQVQHQLPQQEGIQHVVQERDHVHVPGKLRYFPAEQAEQPADLGEDAEQAEAGIDEHPLDLVQA